MDAIQSPANDPATAQQRGERQGEGAGVPGPAAATGGLHRLDGVYVPGPTDDDEPVFLPAPEPTPEQVRWLCEQVATRARRLVARRPWNEPPEECVTPMFKVVGEPPKPAENKRLHVRVDGFDLHASTAFAADQRDSVERLPHKGAKFRCKFALRGPIANGQLTSGPRDLLTYRLKTPKPDGSTQLVLSPMTLLERLARLVPAPRLHLTRYFGVLSNAARWRKHIVPKPRDSNAIPRLKRSGRWLDWATLLRRVFLAEVLACACGGTRRVIAQIEPGPTARKIPRILAWPIPGPSSPPPASTRPISGPRGRPQTPTAMRRGLARGEVHEPRRPALAPPTFRPDFPPPPLETPALSPGCGVAPGGRGCGASG